MKYKYLTQKKIYLDENLEPKLMGSLYLKEKQSFSGYLYRNILTVFMPYLFLNDVNSYALTLYLMFSTKNLDYMFLFPIGPYGKISLLRPDTMPDHYWDLIQKCMNPKDEECPKFEEITNLLKDDKFALEEFGMKTDLDQLHDYQRRVDIDE